MRRAGPRGAGGILGCPTPSAELTALLQQDAGAYTWAAATVGSNNAAGYQLATQEPVMAVGGFNGTDPAPTLAQFQAARGRAEDPLVRRRRTPSAAAARPRPGGSDDAARIARWVQENFTATTVGGTTVYDLTGAGS